VRIIAAREGFAKDQYPRTIGFDVSTETAYIFAD
jgi:hypothetical protein